MHDVATSTVTVLLTDLAETRRLWREHGAAVPAVSARYKRLVRSAAAAHAGTDMKTTGTVVRFGFPDHLGRRRGGPGCPGRPAQRGLGGRRPAGAPTSAHGYP